MPNEMGSGIQAVVIGNEVYVGGGAGHSEVTVTVYSLQTRTWRALPLYESRWFGMGVVNNQLVLVGGLSTSSRKVTNVVGMWDQQSQIWTYPFPVMPTAGHSVSVIVYKKWLILAGGRDDNKFPLSQVVLLDTLSAQWYEGSPLPKDCTCMSSAINGNMWYLSRGLSHPNEPNKHIFSVCLDALISQAVSQSAGSTSQATPSLWQILPEVPLIHSNVLIIRGSLLTVGGRESSAIHLYQPSSSSWIEVCDLPTHLWLCACIILPSGEIFVAGGRSGFHDTNSVDIATIL